MDIKPYRSAMADCASLLDVVGLPPRDKRPYELWRSELDALFHDCATEAELTEGQIETREEVMESFIRILLALPRVSTAPFSALMDIDEEEGPKGAKKPLTLYEKIKNMPQIIQRTPAWYTMRAGALSATNISTLFASPRQYAILVHEKAGLLAPQSKNSQPACATAAMTPFDWGIRFEPCLRECMEKIWAQPIEEVGCIAHENPTIRLVASPDGLLRSGLLVEFKCPISRSIGGNIPDDYWQQMQIQMEVTGAEECQYVEAVFRSDAPERYKRPIGPALPYSGVITLYRESEGGSLLYDYSGDHHADVSEKIPWELFSYMRVTVARDRKWFQSEVLPRIQRFWEDCELARAGKFPIPEARKRVVKCAIDMDVDLE